MSLTDIFNGQSEQLTNFSEVELIYYTANEINNKKIITYTVVCDLESVISKPKLLRTVIATREVIKTLYSHTDIIIDYKLISLKEFEENMMDTDETELNNAQIIYSNNELLNSIIEKKQVKQPR